MCFRFDLIHCLLSCPAVAPWVAKSALPTLQSVMGSNPTFLEKRVVQLVYLPLPCCMSNMSRIAIKIGQGLGVR